MNESDLKIIADFVRLSGGWWPHPDTIAGYLIDTELNERYRHSYIGPGQEADEIKQYAFRTGQPVMGEG